MEIIGNNIKLYNNREININIYDFDKNLEINAKNIVRTLPELRLLPGFLQGKMTLIPITSEIYLSYCINNKMLLVIPQNKPQEYVFFQNIDEQQYVSFIKRLIWLECKV